MNDQLITAIERELAPVLMSRVVGRTYQLSRASIAIDFRGNDNRYLFISVDPATDPRLYLIERRPRELEKEAIKDSSFAQLLRKHIGGAQLTSLTKDENDRIVRFGFATPDALGNNQVRTLIAQLTGKAANLLLLDERGYIIDALRTPHGEGQQIGDQYEPPAPASSFKAQPKEPHAALPFAKDFYATLSEAADAYYRERAAARQFDARATTLAQHMAKLIRQKEKLGRDLQGDLAAHGDADEHKHLGDLLLANLTTAVRRDGIVTLTDFYAEGEPPIELEVDENSSLQEEAARRFTRYTKAKRAAREIATRLDVLEAELETLRSREAELKEIIAARDEAALAEFEVEKKKEKRTPSRSQKSPESVTGARRYRSSDGYEILVGRAARDNDQLTFRVARPHDLWLHAADYPGSHVVVRNPTRKEIPHRTVIEAAELAANFSQARTNAKVDVHYTQRKFLSKPKNSAPGLVRMSSFRTIAVEPRESIERI